MKNLLNQIEHWGHEFTHLKAHGYVEQQHYAFIAELGFFYLFDNQTHETGLIDIPFVLSLERLEQVAISLAGSVIRDEDELFCQTGTNFLIWLIEHPDFDSTQISSKTNINTIRQRLAKLFSETPLSNANGVSMLKSLLEYDFTAEQLNSPEAWQYLYQHDPHGPNFVDAFYGPHALIIDSKMYHPWSSFFPNSQFLYPY